MAISFTMDSLHDMSSLYSSMWITALENNLLPLARLLPKGLPYKYSRNGGIKDMPAIRMPRNWRNAEADFTINVRMMLRWHIDVLSMHTAGPGRQWQGCNNYGNNYKER
jgi:hypothetical protein